MIRTCSKAWPVGLALVTVAVALGCSDSQGPDETDLERNLAKWKAQGLSAYRFDYRLNCFCGGPGVSSVTIVVLNGAVAQVTLLESGVNVPPEEVSDYPTVEDLFERIRKALDQKPHSIRAEYDATLGYPKDVFIDFEVNIADEEFGFIVSNLASLPAA